MSARRLALATVLALGGATLAPGQETAGPTGAVRVIRSYTGKYSDSDWLKPMLESLPKRARAGIGVVCDRLGVTPATIDAGRITILLTDAASGHESRFPDVPHAPAFTAFRPRARAKAATIVLHTEFLARPHGLDADAILRHELAHAVLAQHLPETVVVPAWVDEGLAVWASDDGGTMVRRTALARALRSDTASVCDGLESRVEESHGGGDYAEDYLAFLYLTEKGGAGAVKQFVRELRLGRNFAQAVHGASQRSWAAFHAGARMQATAWLTGQHDPALQAAIKILRQARDRRDAQTLRLATAFLAEHGESEYVGAVLFARAAALTNMGRYGPGRKAFEQSFDRGSLFDDDCCFYIASIAAAGGKHTDAVPWLERLARDYPDSPRFDNAMYDYGFALHLTGKPSEARAHLAKCIATWPQPRSERRLARAKQILDEAK